MERASVMESVCERDIERGFDCLARQSAAAACERERVCERESVCERECLRMCVCV